MISRRVSGFSHLAALGARLCLCLIAACATACVSTSSVHVPSHSSRAARTAQSDSARAGYHVVRAGETLNEIAFRYRVDVRALVRWNEIRNPDVIHVGQRLRVTPPHTATRAAEPARPSTRRAAAPPSATTGGSGGSAVGRSATPPPSWLWPTDGEVVTRFGSTAGIATGIGIRGREGQPVRAAEAGRVVYAGGGLIGYGQLVIIKHNDTYLTAYGYNSRLLVEQGQEVRRGATIAFMGQGPERQPRLHFEIRRDGVPVDPLLMLSAPR